MSPNVMFQLGRGLMLVGLLVVGVGLLYALKVEAQRPEDNPLPMELVAVAIGFFAFTVGRWLAAKGQGNE